MTSRHGEPTNSDELDAFKLFGASVIGGGPKLPISKIQAVTKTEVLATTPTARNPLRCIGIDEEDIEFYYPMHHSKRGHALILNYEKFDPSRPDPAPERRGSSVDASRLEKSLGELGFEVTRADNLTSIDTLGLLRKVASLDEHGDADAFIVAVLSHGDQDELGRSVFYTYNAKLCISEDLVSRFTGSRCPLLIKKPKLFFVQACQGARFDRGVEVLDFHTNGNGNGHNGHSNGNGTCDSSRQRAITLPEEADILVAYSTPPGYYSWRNETDGSWFIHELCSGLDRWAYKLEMTHLLTRVCRHVATSYESHGNNPAMTGMKQCPSFVSRLTHHLLFTPKQS